MSKVCAVTGKRPQKGHRVSHANNKTRRRFLPNLKRRRIWSPNENRFITLKISVKGLRLIDKIGVDAALFKLQESERG